MSVIFCAAVAVLFFGFHIIIYKIMSYTTLFLSPHLKFIARALSARECIIHECFFSLGGADDYTKILAFASAKKENKMSRKFYELRCVAHII